MRLRAALMLACVCVASRSARADGPLPPNRGDRITTSDYAVDLFQGPVLANTRIMALSGAYTAVGEGAEGIPFNPASASLRLPHSTTKLDWDISGGITAPTRVSGTDFDNNGKRGFRQQEDFLFGSLGGYVQYGHLAIGLMVSLQTYGIEQNPLLRTALPAPAQPESAPSGEPTDRVDVRFFRVEPVVSYGFLDDQLHVGAGPRAMYVQIAGDLSGAQEDGTTAARASGADLFTNYAIGAQAGVLWTPYDLPLRVGGAVRSPLALTEDRLGGGASGDGDVRAGHVYLPKRAALPWELEGGVAVQLWERPLNVAWRNEEQVPGVGREEAHRMLRRWYRSIPRRKVLLTTSMLLSGPVSNAVGVESMLSGRVERSGQDPSLTLRGGLEAEVVPYWLVLRGGSYLEPSRFRHSSPRVHATAGFQVRVFEWDAFGLAEPGTLWRLSAAGDAARDYLAWNVGLGIFR